MDIVDLYASDWVIDKLAAKHRIDLDEVWQVLQSEERRIFRGRQGSYVALGQTDAGRYLAVFFYVEPAAGGVCAHIATARDMDDAERRRFGRK